MRIAMILGVLLLAACSASQQSQYHLVKSTPVAGEGGWDYVKVDKHSHHVYITHTDKVDVLDADSGNVVGVIDGLHGVHEVSLAHDLGHGFISNGKSDSVTVFDIKTLAKIAEVKTGKKPDSLAYEKTTKRLLAFNGESNNSTVIDAVTNKNIGTIALGGAPEFAVSDHAGHVFVNLEDTDETLLLDVASLKVLQRWKVAPGSEPSSLAMDRERHRLFIGCRNKLLVVMNADNGQVITTLPIGDHVDATAFDKETHEVISSTGDGMLTVVAQDDADHYRIVQTIVTQKGSKTFGMDAETHKLFVPAADFAPAKVSKDNPKGRPNVVPGTFKVLIFER